MTQKCFVSPRLFIEPFLSNTQSVYYQINI
uniref:Uncharacterized protein n=1 Tax=Tetranychus urticae TaxID=32264 RepID=T1JRX4_TETUR